MECLADYEEGRVSERAGARGRWEKEKVSKRWGRKAEWCVCACGGVVGCTILKNSAFNCTKVMVFTEQGRLFTVNSCEGPNQADISVYHIWGGRGG